MWIGSLFRNIKWISGHDAKAPSRCRQVAPRRKGRAPCRVPRLEILEDRTVLSTFIAVSYTHLTLPTILRV